METSSPKSTGGGGFVFEDEVAAYFMSFMLAGADAFPGLDLGRLVRIKFQRKVDGWELDDLVLEFEKDGLNKFCAFSVKSNRYISSKKIPKSLVSSLWNQFTRTTDNPFRPGCDYLGLITSGASSSAKNSLSTLRDLAVNHGGANLDIHINQSGFTNENVRCLFSSFSKPANISGNGDVDKTSIIKRFLHCDLELTQSTSQDLIRAENLGSALISGQDKDLWIHLQHIAQRTRTAAGEISYSCLVRLLSEKNFRLKGQRTFFSDLNKLKTSKERKLRNIKHTIGPTLNIQRSLDFSSQFKANQINAFIGESGIGKSNLIKQWALSHEIPTIWLNHSLFRAKSLPEFNELLGIENDLFEIVQYGPSNQIIVVDGIDRISNHNNRELLKSFLLEIRRLLNNRHFCVVCSQDQIWYKTLRHVLPSEISFNIVEAPPFGDLELKEVSQNYPSIKGLLNFDQTKRVLRNPKYIDLAIQMIEKSQLDTTKALNELALINGFWELIGEHGDSREHQVLVSNLAAKQADECLFNSSLNSYSKEDIKGFRELEIKGFISVEDDNKVKFAHDLYGDWARFKFLSSEETSNLRNKIIKRKENVFWNQALQLYSLNLLEKEGFTKWKETVLAFENSGETSIVDIFLDIGITSLNQCLILDRIKDLIFLDDCKYLERFLDRFLAYATEPNEGIMSRREEFQLSEIEASQLYRIPLYRYWPALLIFIDKNLAAISNRAKPQIALIAEKWLIATPYNTLFRKEAARIALECAKWAFRSTHYEERVFVENDPLKNCYQSMLAAYPDLPIEVEKLSLKLIGISHHGLPKEKAQNQSSSLSKDNKLKQQKVETNQFTANRLAAMAWGISTREIRKPAWPHGPKFEKDVAFQSVIFKNANFNILIKENPDLASKILLAAIIENPVERGNSRDSLSISIFNDDFGTDQANSTEFSPPFYTKGPFLSFLMIAPDIAIKTLIVLTDFVTARWEENLPKNGEGKTETEYEMKVGDESKTWKGNSEVFGWSYNLPRCPDVLVSFLMAFEKWLYGEIENHKDIGRWIDLILKESNSIAFIGLFILVAKKSPSLLLGKLKNLLIQPHIILWDQQIISNLTQMSSIKAASYTSLGNATWNDAREWFTSKHKEITLKSQALSFLLNNPNMADFFSEARSVWLDSLAKEYYIDLHILECKFDPSNYKKKKLTDGTIGWEYTPPESLVQKHDKHLVENEPSSLRMLFLQNIIQILEAKSFTVQKIETLEEHYRTKIKIITEDDHSSSSPITDKDCALAVDALKLLASERKILFLSRKENKEIKNSICNALANLWKDEKIHPHDISEYKYDSILAKVIGYLCVNQENDPWIRSLAGYIVCGPRTTAFKCFAQTLFCQGVDLSFFLGVTRLSFEFCKIQTAWKSVLLFLNYQSQENGKLENCTPENIEENYNESVSKLLSDFRDGKIESTWPNWNFSKKSYEFSQNFSFPEFDKDIINIERFIDGLSMLPPISQWPDTLKNGWTLFCSDGLEQIAERLKQSDEIHGAPSDQDTWTIEIFAETFLFNDDPRLTDALKSFLSVGQEERYWLDHLGRHMFRVGSVNTENWEFLIKKAEILFSTADSLNSLTKFPNDTDEIWRSFVGLDDISVQLWPDKSVDLVKAFFPMHKNLLARCTDSLRCLDCFVYLMSKEISNEIRLESLGVVSNAMTGKRLERFSSRRDSISLLSSYLVSARKPPFFGSLPRIF